MVITLHSCRLAVVRHVVREKVCICVGWRQNAFLSKGHVFKAERTHLVQARTFGQTLGSPYNFFFLLKKFPSSSAIYRRQVE
jgi:hypothetical protein